MLLLSRRVLSLVCVLPLLASAVPAHGFALRVGKTGKVLVFNARSVKLTVDASKAGAPGAADAVRAAFASWSAAGSPLRVDIREDDAPGVRGDGRNDVAWVTDNWEHGSDVVAITLTLFKASSGFVSESDIIFNAVDHRFSTAGDGDTSRYDVQNVAVHEAGHFIGLGHSEVGPSTMFATTPPGEVAKRDLDADDREALVALIEELGRRGVNTPQPVSKDITDPDPEEPLIERVGDGSLATRIGCSAVGRGGENGLGATLLVLLALLLLTRRRVRVVAALSLLAALLAAPSVARATVVRAVTLRALATRATLVVEGRVVAQRSRYRGHLIVTESVIETRRCHKGTCSRGARVTLTTLGGVVGDVGMHVSGVAQLRVGERVFVFATRRAGALRTVGLAQGLFRLQGELARRDLTQLHFVGGSPPAATLQIATLRALVAPSAASRGR
ncbi:MAG: matrixin family metalloprotease [Myxococcales bacterium]|nr:matrixin family metalloprotease [Myxococcales bacterium]